MFFRLMPNHLINVLANITEGALRFQIMAKKWNAVERLHKECSLQKKFCMSAIRETTAAVTSLQGRKEEPAHPSSRQGARMEMAYQEFRRSLSVGS